MKVVLFTKFNETWDARELGEYLTAVGYDGVDLPVRDGYHFNPDNVRETLPGAVRVWSEMGLTCELISTETNLIDPANRDSVAIFEAAAEAGVPIVKIGFFRHTPGDDYWEKVSAARRALEGFARLSERTGVKTVYQTHSGDVPGIQLRRDHCICCAVCTPSGSARTWTGGHIAINGEDIEMGLAMCREYLTVIGAKDARHVPDKRANPPAPYGPAFVFLGHGAAHWRRLLKTIKRWGFDGPITVHTEYTEDQDVLFTVGGKDLSEEGGVSSGDGRGRGPSVSPP